MILCQGFLLGLADVSYQNTESSNFQKYSYQAELLTAMRIFFNIFGEPNIFQGTRINQLQNALACKYLEILCHEISGLLKIK